MKKTWILALCGAAALSLAACAGKPAEAPAPSADGTTQAPDTTAPAGETLTGIADGYGGEITVTLTTADGKVTACKITGDGETAEIGGKALAELEKQVVAAGGPEIDGVSGATVTSNAVKKAVASAMGVELEEEEKETKAPETVAPAALIPIDGGLQIGQVYAAAHGTSCFTEAVAVVQDDVIVAAYIDEFQFLDQGDGIVGVPNSDADFAAGYAEGKVLASKRENAEYYSKLMTEMGGATVTIDGNFDAIQNYVVGKTISEVKALAGKDDAVDAISGATLADTAGYLSAIADAAEAAKNTQAVEFTGDSSALKLNVAYAAAHGTKCFTTAAALTDGENILLSYIDDFQFISKDAGVTGVPNSDGSFGEGVAEGNILCSKRVATDYYSKNMAEKGGSTVAIDKNFDAVQNYINGKKVAEITDLAGSESPVDAISGATLVDTAGYLNAVLKAAGK